MATKEKSNSNSAENKHNALAWRQEVAKEYSYCMISTLNQMVNYLPMLLLDFQQTKMYVTLSGAQNDFFDKCLYDTCEMHNEVTRFKMADKKISLDDINKVSAIKDTLRTASRGKKVLWNITGGQRPIMLAVFELLKEGDRKDDLVVYLEGNSGKLVWMEVKDQMLVPVPASVHSLEQYKIDENSSWLNIRTALKLMGIKEYGKYKVYDGNKSDAQAIKSLCEKYRKEEHLRKQLLALNRKDLDKTGYKDKAVLQDDAKAASYFSTLNPNELEEVRKHKDETFPFGHLLEEMYAQNIYEVAKDNIAEMVVNLKLRPMDEKKHEDGNKKQTDEIDIILLTKTGQLVVFEVKSGGMDGDVAKSTKYTTYAIAGVYGKPILLTALLKNQLADLKSLSNQWPYDTSSTAVRSARRAQLPIIALDGDENNDFEPAIKKLLHL